MSDVIIIDTDILIDAGRGIELALACLTQYESEQVTLAISVITKMELVVGCRDKGELRDMEKFLHRFQIFNIDEMTSIKADEILQQYRLSHGLLIPDALIAATALNWRCPLISKNQRDYRFIEELELVVYP
jgi:predicted nucleic acid-binding protein